MKKELRYELHQYSLCLLTDNNIEFRCLSGDSAHYRIGNWDCWLSTGKFWNRVNGIKGKGVEKLIEYIKNEKVEEFTR